MTKAKGAAPRFAAWLCAVALLAVAGGCESRDLDMPECVTAIPEQYVNAAPAEGGVTAAADGPWWLDFGDETLNATMERCFDGNLDLAAALSRVEQAQAQADVENASWWPTLGVDGRAERRKQANLSTLGTNPFPNTGGRRRTFNTVNANLTAAYEVDIWGRLSAQRRAADSRLEATVEDAYGVVLSLSGQVADLYYQAVELRGNLDMASRTIGVYQESLDLVESRYNAGLVSAIDLHQARQNLARVQAQRPVFEQRLIETENALRILAGEYPRPGGNGDASVWPAALSSVTPGVPSELLQRRPDLRAAMRRIEAADHDVAAAIRDRFPTLQLTGSIGGSSSDVLEMFDSEHFLWNVAAGLVAPILDGGRRSAEVERRRAMLREMVLHYASLALGAFQEVENALAAGRTLDEQVRWLEARRDALDQNVATAIEQYRSGLTSYLQVLNAQQSAYDVKIQLNGVYRERVGNRIHLVRALGGSWMRDVVEPEEAVEQDLTEQAAPAETDAPVKQEESK